LAPAFFIGRAFFSEEKKQKTFIRLASAFPDRHEAKLAKVFWFFFSKKNMLASPDQDQGSLVYKFP
jgi:hypothetical protein